MNQAIGQSVSKNSPFADRMLRKCVFQKLCSHRRAREKWDGDLIWFRLRYLDAKRPSSCIKLLSRPQACGRVALYFQPDVCLSRLYLGVPESHLRLLQQMVTDFGFSIKPKPPEVDILAAQRLTEATELPWDRPFLAHIVNEVIFVNVVDGNNKGLYFPQGSTIENDMRLSKSQLLQKPPAGMTILPSWHDLSPPASLIASEPDSQRWLLGRSHAGDPLHVAGRVNIYGRQDAVANWLLHQITQMVRINHSNLVVIDGVGDLVPKLKRKASVTRLLGQRLAYIDFDNTSLATGFNPLASAPGEAEANTVQRWQRWFQGMNAHPDSVQLLIKAQHDGVTNIPGLSKWLRQTERQGKNTAVSNLRMLLNRLTAQRHIRERLEWPTNCFEILPAGALFFSCAGDRWEKQQLLRAVMLGTLAVSDVRIIVHGFPLSMWCEPEICNHKQMVISNGPVMIDSSIVLTESHTKGIAALADRFLANDEQLVENLELLGMSESIVLLKNDLFYSTWHQRERD